MELELELNKVPPGDRGGRIEQMAGAGGRAEPEVDGAAT
jgi:hypothetical protein